jgi:hypothetical protein
MRLAGSWPGSAATRTARLVPALTRREGRPDCGIEAAGGRLAGRVLPPARARRGAGVRGDAPAAGRIGSPAVFRRRKSGPPVWIVGALALVGGALAEIEGRAAPLTRAQAAAALLSTNSGVLIETNVAAVWSPFADFGFGTGHEGLLPAGAVVAPRFLGVEPFPGPGMGVTNPAYFFWIDDAPPAMFVHPTRFVLMDANHPAPTVANGGILVSTQGWWPRLILPGPVTNDFFRADFERVSDEPAGPANPQGLIAGFVPGTGDLSGAGFAALLAAPPARLMTSNQNRACGIVLTGSEGAAFSNDVVTFRTDLIEHYGVDPDRIRTVNNGLPASRAQLAAAIQDLCVTNPPCDKVFIRITTHGGIGSLLLDDESVSSMKLCELFACLVNTETPVCLLVDACHAGSLPDAANWNFAPGSTLLFAARAGRSAWGSVWVEGTFSVYAKAFSECLRSDPQANPGADADGNGFIDDCEAHDWLQVVNPGFRVARKDGTLAPYTVHPAGPGMATGILSNHIAGVFPDPLPQKRVVGKNPVATVMTVRNNTAANTADFHLLYEGDVTNGLNVVEAMRATTNGAPIAPWATNGLMITYDPVSNRTMLCWADTNDVFAPGEHLNVRILRPTGGLRLVRRFWTYGDETPPPPPAERVPAQRVSLYLDPESGALKFYIAPGNDEEADQSSGYQYIPLPSPVPAPELHPASPAVTNPPATTLGSHTLPADAPLELTGSPPPEQPAAPLPAVILRSETSWSLNLNTVTELNQFILDTPPADTECFTNCPHGGIFFTVNPPGPGSVWQWYKDGQPLPGETNSSLVLTNLKGIDEGIYTGIATNATGVKRKFFKLFIEDNTPPVLNCPSNIVVECAGHDGTVVNYSVSASDNCGGPVTIECDPPPGSLFPHGTNFVSCIARDSFQNPAVCTFTVTVVDTTPPLIFCLPDLVFTSEDPVQLFFTPSVFDLCDPEPQAACVPPSGSFLDPGTITTVLCTATDASGNSAQCSFTVTIRRPGDPDLVIEPASPGQLKLTWFDDQALLQDAAAVQGPWTTLSNATSPYVVNIPAEESEHYYRVLFPDGSESTVGAGSLVLSPPSGNARAPEWMRTMPGHLEQAGLRWARPVKRVNLERPGPPRPLPAPPPRLTLKPVAPD